MLRKLSLTSETDDVLIALVGELATSRVPATIIAATGSLLGGLKIALMWRHSEAI